MAITRFLFSLQTKFCFRLYLVKHKSLLHLLKKEKHRMASSFLAREVELDFYVPVPISNLTSLSLLLINDGQDLPKMHFEHLLDELQLTAQITPLVCVGIHAADRLLEYGTANRKDYLNRGGKAKAYQQFILEELLPFIHLSLGIEKFNNVGMAGFSMGGLSALDVVWNHPLVFSIAGVFSASLWWRSKDLSAGYEEERDRIMHQQIRNGRYQPNLRFYFTTGSFDETADRNKNGVIDSIDDTLDLVKELEQLGYDAGYDLKYVNYEEGRHDIESWSKAMPQFLLWGWGRK